MNNASLTLIILTFNEERHIKRCIESANNIADRIIVIDSGSTDKTCILAKEFGAEVYYNQWINHSTQLNWALDNISIDTKWIFRLDADEIIMPDLDNKLKDFLNKQEDSVSGVTLNRRIYFMGKWIRHGGIYPIKQLRVWKSDRGRCEDRWMDEHIIVDGKVVHLNQDFSDINLNNIDWWITKHNQYASRECMDMLMFDKMIKFPREDSKLLSNQAKFKRWIKLNIYMKLPLGIRPVLYFLYRYIILLGFLDGSKGFTFHFMQGLWYRYLVDIKINEVRILIDGTNMTLEEVIEEQFGFKVN